ncbi:hypothetical protein ABK040_013957 [Willaertia magna]
MVINNNTNFEEDNVEQQEGQQHLFLEFENNLPFHQLLSHLTTLTHKPSPTTITTTTHSNTPDGTPSPNNNNNNSNNVNATTTTNNNNIELLLECLPEGFKLNQYCSPAKTKYSVYVNDIIKVTMKLALSPMHLSKQIQSQPNFEQCYKELTNTLQESKLMLELRSFTDSPLNFDETYLEACSEFNGLQSSSSSTNLSTRSSSFHIPRPNQKRNNKRSSGASNNNNSITNSVTKKVGFVQVIALETKQVLAKSEMIWIRSKSRVEMELKKKRASTQQAPKKKKRKVKAFEKGSSKKSFNEKQFEEEKNIIEDNEDCCSTNNEDLDEGQEDTTIVVCSKKSRAASSVLEKKINPQQEQQPILTTNAFLEATSKFFSSMTFTDSIFNNPNFFVGNNFDGSGLSQKSMNHTTMPTADWEAQVAPTVFSAQMNFGIYNNSSNECCSWINGSSNVNNNNNCCNDMNLDDNSIGGFDNSFNVNNNNQFNTNGSKGLHKRTYSHFTPTDINDVCSDIFVIDSPRSGLTSSDVWTDELSPLEEHIPLNANDMEMDFWAVEEKVIESPIDINKITSSCFDVEENMEILEEF